MLSYETREQIRAIAARPFILAVPAQILGIIIAHLFPESIQSTAIISIFIFTSILLVIIARKSYLLQILTLLLFTFILGVISYTYKNTSNEYSPNSIQNYVKKRTKVAGIVQKAAERGRRTTQVLVAVNSCNKKPCDGHMLFYISDRPIPWRAGDFVQATVTPRTPWSAGNPGEFDYPAYLARRNIFVTGFLRKSTSLKIIEKHKHQTPTFVIESKRGDLAEWVEQNTSETSTEVLKALTLGMKKGIDKDIRNVFLASGTGHLLAISGLHLGVISTWIFMFVAWFWHRSPTLLRYYGSGQVAAFVTLPLTWCYAALAGFHLATIRAAIMVSIYLLGRLFFRRSDSVNSLFIAAFIILIFMPFSIFEVSFQLSFMSVLAIVIGLPRLVVICPEFLRQLAYGNSLRSTIVKYIGFLIGANLVCFLITTPIILGWFHQFSWIGLFMNVLIVPIYSSILIPLLGTTIFLKILGFPYISTLLIVPDKLFVITENLQKAIIDSVGGSMYLPSLPFGTWTAYLVGIAIIMYAIKIPKNPFSVYTKDLLPSSKKTKIYLGIGIIFVVISTGYGFSSVYDNKHHSPPLIVVPHFKHGTGVFVINSELSDFIAMGFSDKNDFDPGKRVIAPFLWKFGLSGVENSWFLSRSETKNVETNINKFIDLGEIKHNLWGVKCSIFGNLQKCEDPKKRSKVQIWKVLSDIETKSGIVSSFIEYQIDKLTLFVFPSPHRIEPTIWSELKEHTQTHEIAVVFSGPGRIESFDAMIEDLQPDIVVLAMNRKLIRYLSNKKWLEMKKTFPKVLRTDRSGAVKISIGKIAEPLGHSQRSGKIHQ